MTPSNTELPMSETYEVISYQDIIVFNYTLPGKDTEDQIDREVIFVWEGTLEKFLEESKSLKPYKIDSFKREQDKNRFIANIENDTEKIMDEVEDEISQKMKFGNFFRSPTYQD